jgi:hypothetical protein
MPAPTKIWKIMALTANIRSNTLDISSWVLHARLTVTPWHLCVINIPCLNTSDSNSSVKQKVSMFVLLLCSSSGPLAWVERFYHRTLPQINTCIMHGTLASIVATGWWLQANSQTLRNLIWCRQSHHHTWLHAATQVLELAGTCCGVARPPCSPFSR